MKGRVTRTLFLAALTVGLAVGCSSEKHSRKDGKPGTNVTKTDAKNDGPTQLVGTTATGEPALVSGDNPAGQADNPKEAVVGELDKEVVESTSMLDTIGGRILAEYLGAKNEDLEEAGSNAVVEIFADPDTVFSTLQEIALSIEELKLNKKYDAEKEARVQGLEVAVNKHLADNRESAKKIKTTIGVMLAIVGGAAADRIIGVGTRLVKKVIYKSERPFTKWSTKAMEIGNSIYAAGVKRLHSFSGLSGKELAERNMERIITGKIRGNNVPMEIVENKTIGAGWQKFERTGIPGFRIAIDHNKKIITARQLVRGNFLRLSIQNAPCLQLGKTS